MWKFSFMLVFINGILFSQQTQIGFLENKGQIRNQNNIQDSTVLFLFPSPSNYNVQFSKKGFAYDFYKYQEDSSLFESGTTTYPNQEIQTHRLNIAFLNADTNALLTASEIHSDYFNFLQNYDSTVFFHQVKHYDKLKYENIYPNIDLIFKIINHKVKYDFVVNPGGNINDIRLKFSGHSDFQFLDSVLQFGFSFGQNFESIPMSYYTDTSNQVSIQYNFIDSLNNQVTVGFQFQNPADEDNSQTLIIDPEPDLYYGNYMGNSFFNTNSSVITNKNGEVVTSGTSVNLMSFASNGTNANIHTNKTYDAFLSKIDKYGNLLWTTFYQGKHIELGEAVQVDTMLNYYLIGTNLTQDSTQLDSTFLKKDCYILKSRNNGDLVYFKSLNQENNEFDVKAITDFPGNLYVSSTVDSLLLADSIQKHLCIRKIDLSGNVSWTKQFDGNKNDVSTGISYGNNKIIVSGYTNSDLGIATSLSYQDSLKGNTDGFILALDTDGNQLWSTYFGGDSLDFISGLKAFNDDIFFVGKTNSTNNIASSTAFQDSLLGKFDAFLADFDSNGNLLWSSYFGGSNFDEALSISRELDSNIFILGKTNSSDSISFGNVYQDSLSGEMDCFVTKFTRTGERIWSTYYGGQQNESPKSIHVFGNTSIYLAGKTNSPSNIPDDSRLKFGNEYFSHYDGFLSKFTQDKSTIFLPDLDTTSLSDCFGSGVCNGNSTPDTNEYVCNRNYRCLGEELNLTWNYGELGTDAQWVWYLNGCGDGAMQLGTGDYLNYTPTSSCTIFIRAESISNSTPCASNYYFFAPLPTARIYTDSTYCVSSNEILFTDSHDSIIWSKSTTFLSQNDSLTITNPADSANGLYQLKVYNIFGCSDTTSTNVGFNPSPSATIIRQDESCDISNNGSIEVTLSNPNDSLTWLNLNSSNVLSIDSLDQGEYFLKITNEFSCEFLDTVIISGHQSLSFDSIVVNPTCGFFNGSLEIIPSSTLGVSYLWNNLPDTSKIDSLKAGAYNLVITDSNECIYNFDFELISQDSLYFDVNPIVSTINIGDSVQLLVNQNFEDTNITYSWFPLEGLSCSNCLEVYAYPTQNQECYIFANDTNNCFGQRKILINVIQDTTIQDTIIDNPDNPCIDIFIPDHFSPNGDNLNDEWCVIGNCITHQNLQVFNQWHQLVFESNANGACWDGTYHGELVQADAYFYSVHLVTSNQGVIHLNGIVYVQY